MELIWIVSLQHLENLDNVRVGFITSELVTSSIEAQNNAPRSRLSNNGFRYRRDRNNRVRNEMIHDVRHCKMGSIKLELIGIELETNWRREIRIESDS